MQFTITNTYPLPLRLFNADGTQIDIQTGETRSVTIANGSVMLDATPAAMSIQEHHKSWHDTLTADLQKKAEEEQAALVALTEKMKSGPIL